MNSNSPAQLAYIIDDDEAVRDSMGMLLESANIQYTCFSSADEFLNAFDGQQRGCLVLDIRMPGMTGLELQDRLRELNAVLPIIFITGHGDVPMAVEAMQRGAIDFMRKPVNEQDLLERVQQAFELESGIVSQMLDREQSKILIESLTQREYEIFELVAEGQANKVIAFDLGISERTVEVHRSQVMKKLGAKTLAQLVRIHLEI